MALIDVKLVCVWVPTFVSVRDGKVGSLQTPTFEIAQAAVDAGHIIFTSTNTWHSGAEDHRKVARAVGRLQVGDPDSLDSVKPQSPQSKTFASLDSVKPQPQPQPKTFASRESLSAWLAAHADWTEDVGYDPSLHCDYACLRGGCSGSCNRYRALLKQT